jgi:Holliday junction resolvase/uncharacterized protein YutE (UPF0331/DUF86 family)
MITPKDGHTRELLESIAEDYRRRGYQVFVEPSGVDLPPFLSSETPDLIAHRGDEHLVIEVKESPNDADLQQVRMMTDRISREPGWRFVLMAARASASNPASVLPASLDERGITNAIAQAEALTNAGYPEAAVMLAWAATEAALRSVLADSVRRSDHNSPAVLLRSAASEGIIESEDFKKLNDSLQVRNAIAHGFRHIEADLASQAADVTKLLSRVTGSLLRELREPT